MKNAKRFLKEAGVYGAVSAAVLLLLLLAVCFLPAARSVWASFRENQPENGLFDGNWIGLKTYKILFRTSYLQTAVWNSLVLGFLGGILPVLPGWFMGRVVAARPSSSWIWTGALLLPAFLPADFTAILLWGSAFPKTGKWPWLCYFCIEGVRILFLTAFLTAALGRLFSAQGRPRREGVRLGALAMLALGLMRLLSPDNQVCRVLQTSQNLADTEILSTFTMFQVPRVNLKTTVWTIQQLLQLPAFLAGTLLLLYLFRRIGKQEACANEAAERGGFGAVFSAVLAAGLFTGLVIWKMCSFPGDGVTVSNTLWGTSVLYLLMTMTLAVFWLPAGGWLCGKTRWFPILLCLAVPLAENIFGTSLVFYRQRIYGTVFFPILTGISPFFILLLGLMGKSEKPERSFKLWCKNAAPFLCLFLGMLAVQCWTGVGKQEYFLQNTEATLSYSDWHLMTVGTAYINEQGGMTSLNLWLALPAALLAAGSVIAFGMLMDHKKTSAGKGRAYEDEK